MRKFLMALVAMSMLMAGDAMALKDCPVKNFVTAAARDASTPKDCTIGYALDDDTFKWRANGSWVSISTGTTLTGANSGTITNAVDTEWQILENSEDLDLDFKTNEVEMSSDTGVIDFQFVGIDIVADGGVGALEFPDGDETIVLADNDATALEIGLNEAAGALLTLNTGDSTESVIIKGTTTVEAFKVDTGTATFDEAATFGAGAGAVTFSNTAASIVTGDNDTSALDIGSTGLTTALRYSSEDNKEVFTFGAGTIKGTVSVTGAYTVDESDCGKTLFVTAAHDGNEIGLPATIAGCELEFMYVGADGGALLDISPNASDAIHGSCTLAASVVEFSGADDADVGLTKASINTGDFIRLIGDGTEGWYATGIVGICANN